MGAITNSPSSLDFTQNATLGAEHIKPSVPKSTNERGFGLLFEGGGPIIRKIVFLFEDSMSELNWTG